MMTDGGWSLEPTPTAVVSPTPTVIPDVTPTGVDSRAALAKLTSGQTLTDADKKALGLPVTTNSTTTNPTTSTTTTNPTTSTVVTGRTQNLPAGFTAGKFPAEFVKFFGEPPADIMGWRLDQKTDTKGRTYYQLSISQKGAYGENVTGSSTFGAWLTKDASGNWTTAPMDDAGGSSNSQGNSNVTGNTTGTSTSSTSTGPSLAKDVFKGTLGLLFGQAEVGKPWMDELYTVVSKYYKGGATAEESFNLAIQDVRNNPNMQEFTKRFKGIYALQDLRQQGKPVTVPTIAEYFATQTKMADLLKATGLADIATEDFLGDVIGKGVSATEFGNRITNIFDRIDLAPQEIKDTLSRYYPTLDRIQLAKALALGEKGSVQLQKDLATYEILGAAEEQGLGAYGAGAIAGGLTEERAASLAAAGETFQSALGKFKTVAALKTPAEKLAAIYGTGPMTQADIENIVFKQSAQETTALENLVKAEEAAFSGQSGNIGSRSFASQARGAGLI